MIFREIFKKRKIIMLCCALTMIAGTLFLNACSFNNNKQQNDSDLSIEAEVDYDGDTTVFVVDDTQIKVSEAMWYVYIFEEQFSEDAKKYKELNGTSFYDAKGNDKGETVRQAIKNEIVDMVYYYEILSQMAVEMASYNIEDENYFEEEAKKFMDGVPKEKVEQYYLNQKDYENILRKRTLADLIKNDIKKLYEVDRDQLMKENYSNEELDEFSEEEYEQKADELEYNYREQAFRTEYTEIESNHKFEVISEVWSAIPVGE